MTDATAAPATEIRVSLDALALCARRLDEAAQAAGDAARATTDHEVSVTSFGLMNTALGATVVPFVSRARALTTSLDQASTALASGSHTLAEGWRLAEQDAAKASARLTEALEELGP